MENPLGSSTLSLRFYTTDLGNSVTQMIETTIADIAIVVTKESERYWKIPELIEVWLTLTAQYDIERAFNDILRRLGGEWRIYGTGRDSEAIWSSNIDNQFSIPGVTWAILQLVYPVPSDDA